MVAGGNRLSPTESKTRTDPTIDEYNLCVVGAIHESPVYIHKLCGRFVNRPYNSNSLISSLAVNFYASSVRRMRVHVSAEVLAYVLSAVHFRTTYSIHGRAQQTIIYRTQNIFWYYPLIGIIFLHPRQIKMDCRKVVSDKNPYSNFLQSI